MEPFDKDNKRWECNIKKKDEEIKLLKKQLADVNQESNQKENKQILNTNENIKREVIKENENVIFVYGDNTTANEADKKAIKNKSNNDSVTKASGWQAAAMRPKITKWKQDIQNSIWIPTMDDFWKKMSDKNIENNKKIIYNSILEIEKKWKWKKILIPYDKKKWIYNIWTWIAELEKSAPETYKYLQEKLKKIKNQIRNN